MWGSWGELDGVACGHFGSRRLPSSPFAVALSHWLFVADSATDALPHLSVSFDTQQQRTTCCNFFEGDHIDPMTALIDAEVALARPGKAVHVDGLAWWSPWCFLMEEVGCRDDLGGHRWAS